MTTEQVDAAIPETETTDAGTKPSSTKRVRSPYLFPAYNFNLARQVAERVELDGGGNLSDETLAISLRLSAKSSGFNLKTLTARQFGMLTKQGNGQSTTPLAKRILKPTSDEERRKAMAESFMAIPLFREVATRYKGQPIPLGQTMRNVLEREFGIDCKRVADAERVLMDSARDSGVLVVSGNNTYISIERVGVITSTAKVTDSPDEAPLPPPRIGSSRERTGDSLLVISEEDLAGFDDKEFDEIWGALGKIIKARGQRKIEGSNTQKGEKRE